MEKIISILKIAIIITILLIIFLYFKDQFTGFNSQTQSAEQVQENNKFDSWEDALPYVKDLIKQEYKDQIGWDIDESLVNIFEEADITGDGIHEAIIDTGQGGEYTDYLMLMRFKNKTPVIASLQKKEATMFSSFGTGASVRHGLDSVMLAEHNALYLGNWGTDYNGDLEYCEIDAYEWDIEKELFKYNQELTDLFETEYCEDKEEQVTF